MADLKWKRALEDAYGPAEPPSKKQKPTNGTEASSLEASLDLLKEDTSIAELTRHHARELLRLLKVENNEGPTKNGTKKPDEPENAHTAVPPPFPKVPHIPAKSKSPTNSTSSLPNVELPPLPPITEPSLLQAPFTHASMLPHYVTPSNTNNYESLEFLGDAYLEIIATRLIHNRFPCHSVGQKAGLREIMIRNDTLAQYAAAYGFNERIKCEIRMREIGGRVWTKVLADVFEAYVACVILSDEMRGFETAEEWLTELWGGKIQQWEANGDGKTNIDSEVASNDVKSLLQKHLISRGAKLEYIEEKPMELVKAGNRTTFFVGVYLSGWGYERTRLGSGSGRNKQIAGAEAAKDAFITGRKIVEDAHRKKVEYDAVQKQKTPHNARPGIVPHNGMLAM